MEYFTAQYVKVSMYDFAKQVPIDLIPCIRKVCTFQDLSCYKFKVVNVQDYILM